MSKKKIKDWIRIGGISGAIILLACTIRVIALAYQEQQHLYAGTLPQVNLPDQAEEVADTNLIDQYTDFMYQQAEDSIHQLDLEEKSLQIAKHLNELLPQNDSISTVSVKGNEKQNTLEEAPSPKSNKEAHSTPAKKRNVHNRKALVKPERQVVEKKKAPVQFKTGFVSRENTNQNNVTFPEEDLKTPDSFSTLDQGGMGQAERLYPDNQEVTSERISNSDVPVTLSSQYLKPLEPVNLSLEQDLPQFGLKKGDLLTASCTIQGDKAFIEVQRIRFEGKLISVKFPCYTLDGERGIALNESYSNDPYSEQESIAGRLAEQAADEIINRVPGGGLIRTGKDVVEGLLNSNKKEESHASSFYLPEPITLNMKISQK